MRRQNWEDENTGRCTWNKVEFGLRLAMIRNQHNISARKLSFELGHNKNYIYSIESGNNFPTMEGFLDICSYLNIEPGQFFRDASEHFFFSYFTEVLEKLNESQLQHLFQLAEDLASNNQL